MKYLAFDLGAGSGKLFSGIFDGDRLSLRRVHSFRHPIITLKNGLYWDFMGIYEEMSQGIVKANADGEIDSMGIDGFNCDFSFIDERGELLFPVRSYRDPRTTELEERIYERMSREKLYAYTGNQLAPFNTLMALAAMRLNGQGYVLDNAYRMLHLPDLLAYYITGRAATEYTLAAEMQMLDWTSLDWIDAVLNAFGIPKKILAPLVLPGSILGRSEENFNRRLGIKGFDFVSVCEHDTASAFLASPLKGDMALISSGTWALAGVETDKPVINDYGFSHNIANEGGLKGHHRLLKNIMGSWLLEQLRADLAGDGVHVDYAQMQRLAAEAKPFEYRIDPDDPTFYQPGGMRRKLSEASRRNCGRRPQTPGEFFRCVYEGLVMKYRYTIETLEALTGRKIDTVNIMGGGALDTLCCTLAASALNRRVICGPVDASSIGNIIVQMLAHGEIANIEEGKEVVARSFEIKEFWPERAEMWSDAYQAYKELFTLGREKK